MIKPEQQAYRNNPCWPGRRGKNLIKKSLFLSFNKRISTFPTKKRVKKNLFSKNSKDMHYATEGGIEGLKLPWNSQNKYFVLALSYLNLHFFFS